MINRQKGEEKIRRETPYPGDRSQDTFPCLRYSHGSPLFRREKNLQKNGQKAAAVISQSSFFPRKKARTFVLTFEKLSEPSENTLTKQKMN
jgi:hypothetical protein